MRKETMTYTDYNGVQRTEDFYFNLSKAEVLKMQTSAAGGLDEVLKKLIATQDQPAIMKTFEDFICMAYGEKDVDGHGFNKTPEILAKFKATEAYSDLYVRLALDADYASKFIHDVLPKDMEATFAKYLKPSQESNNN